MRSVLKRCLVVWVILSLIVFLAWERHQPKHPLISVVMPVYNRADLLPRAISTILSQTYPHFELIIVDDGSTDESVSVARRFSEKDTRIKLYINDKNRGISYTRNRGMDLAKGKYLFIMDSDDYAKPFALEYALGFMEQDEKLAFVYPSCYTEIERDGKIRTFIVKRMPFENILFNNVFSNVGSMVRLSFVRQHNIRYDETLSNCEDYQFWVDILKAGGHAERSQKISMGVRFHKTNSQQYYNDMSQNRQKVSDDLQSWLGIPQNIRNNRCAVARFLMTTNQSLFGENDLKSFEKAACYQE